MMLLCRLAQAFIEIKSSDIMRVCRGGDHVSEIDGVAFEKRPSLRKPYFVCGVNGWVNGGDVSIGGVNYLIRQFKAEKFAEMKASRYHVYQVPGAENLRPVFKMQDGLI